MNVELTVPEAGGGWGGEPVEVLQGSSLGPLLFYCYIVATIGTERNYNWQHCRTTQNHCRTVSCSGGTRSDDKKININCFN